MSTRLLVVKRFKTAIRRHQPSRPVSLAWEHGLIQPRVSVLDYGCGYGDDVQHLIKYGYSGFVVGNPRPSGLRSLSLPWNDSRSVLAVKGPLRRAEGAPLTAPLRSKPHI